MTVTATPATGGLLAANLICMASMMIWAAGLPASTVLIPVFPPIPLAGLRLALAGAILLAVWWLVDGRRAVLDADWLRGIGVGGVCLGIGSILMITALSLTDAVTVAVISATTPVFGIALECLLDGRRVTTRLMLGLILSLAGGLGSYAAAMGNLTLGLGAATAIGSVLCYTWGSRATVTAFPALTPLGRTAITVCGAAVVACTVAAIHAAFGGTGPDWGRVGWAEIGALALFCIGSVTISQLLWIMSVGRLGIGTSSLHMNAAPFYVMVILFALGGTWAWTQFFCAVIVVLGVLIAQGLIPGRRA